MNAPLRLLFSHVLHAVTFTFDDNRFAVMEQSVEYCACDGAVVVEYLGPLFKWAVAGDYQRTAFISFRYDLEEQIRPELVYREISQLVNYKKLYFGVLFQCFFKAVHGLCGGKGIDDVHCSGEEDGVALLAGFRGEGNRKMRFAFMESFP